VTVVVATFNASHTIDRCLESVFTQTYPHRELLVVDGASTDGTAEAVRRQSERIAWWVSEPDSGVYDAWNKALAHASGDWIVFLGADDVFASHQAISRMASHLRAAEGRYRVVYASVDVVAQDGMVVRAAGEPWALAGPAFRERMAIPHQGTFHHRSLFEEHGSFDPGFRICGDYEFLLRELLEHEALFVPDLTVVKMGYGGLSHSPTLMARHVRETHRARYAHGLVDTPDWRSFEVLRATTHARLTQTFGRRTADAVGDLYRAVTRTQKRRPDHE
jgi:glycosyltransferase involved in cell wall biosynthesis